MTLNLLGVQRFSFSARPMPVPGDLRINWRLAIILLMLENSRSKRASLAKLHVLNEAVRSTSARITLEKILDEKAAPLNWQLRVEPAFGRAINFVVGENLVQWTRTAQRAGLQLTKKGAASAEALVEAEDTLIEEKHFLSTIGKRVSEDFVNKILYVGRG